METRSYAHARKISRRDSNGGDITQRSLGEQREQRGRQSPVAHTMSKLTILKRLMISLFHSFLLLFCLYILLFLAGTSFLSVEHFFQHGEWRLFWSFLPLGSPYETGTLSAVLLSVWLMTHLERRPFVSLGVQWTQLSLPLLILGAILGLGHMVIIEASLVFSNTTSVDLGNRFSISSILLMLYTFSSVAIYEELLFRGYVLQTLIRGGGLAFGVVTSAALFTAVHFPEMHNLLSLWLMGVALAIITLKTRSLWMPIGLHFGWNVAAHMFPQQIENSPVIYVTGFLTLIVLLVVLDLSADRESRLLWKRYVHRPAWPPWPPWPRRLVTGAAEQDKDALQNARVTDDKSEPP